MRLVLSLLALLALTAAATLPGAPAARACFRPPGADDPRSVAILQVHADAEPVRVPAPAAVAAELRAASEAADPAARRRAVVADLGAALDAAWARLEAATDEAASGTPAPAPARLAEGFARMKRYEALFAAVSAARGGAEPARAAARDLAAFDAELRAPHCVE